MLCCITFLATSLTIDAAPAATEIVVTNNGRFSLSTVTGNGGTTSGGDSFSFLDRLFSSSTIENDKYYQVNIRVKYSVSDASGVSGSYVSASDYCPAYVFVNGGSYSLVTKRNDYLNNNYFYFKGSDLTQGYSDGGLRLNTLLEPYIYGYSPVVNGSVSSSMNFNFTATYSVVFVEVSYSDYIANNGGSNVNDIATHEAIQRQTEVIQEGNEILEDTNEKTTSFFDGFWDNLLHIFVPEDGFFTQWFNSLNTFMAQKLGFLWSPFDFLLSFLNGVYSGSGSASIVFPELSWIDGTVIIPRTEFTFDNIGGESFQSLRDMIYFATDVILLGAVISQFYKKIKLVFEGGGD